MDHQLKNITVRGYKSIAEQSIQLSDINVLIGQNGAGKSNFISLFRFLRNIIERRLRNVSLKAGAENLLYYGSKTTAEITIDLNFDPNYYYLKLQPANDDSLFIAFENCAYRGRGYMNPYITGISADEKESNLSAQAKTYKIAEHVYDVLRDWRVYHFHDTSESAGVKKYGSLADSKFLFEDASNLAAFLYVLKNTQYGFYERIVKTIQLVVPFFDDFVLRPNPLNEENIRLEWVDRYSDKTFTANELSDGSLRFICMATLLLQKDLPKLILLDEPELGLHPSAITILSGLLKKASKRSQVIISTQSVSLVNEFDAEDIVVVEKAEAETTFRRLDPEKLESWLNDYSLGDLWDKNIIGGKP
ncbi:putative ATPase [Mucilaginibacter oryzae]|uniref:Putative ATPase n=1 Tax=Mucilaginibacter oryzae TaxID=468058 RepID=A0A316HXI9_9SPHI|nr:AAA family ATPase [Mucilaginibacter oryzae]PWK79732.1 putative ATPase [Mucilaginibacter oryzae]